MNRHQSTTLGAVMTSGKLEEVADFGKAGLGNSDEESRHSKTIKFFDYAARIRGAGSQAPL